MEYTRIAGRGIVGHNNEVFTDRTVEECEALCCARDWCRSFDYLPPGGASGQCALSDVDVTNNQATNTEWNSDIYERNHRNADHSRFFPLICNCKLSSPDSLLRCCPVAATQSPPSLRSEAQRPVHPNLRRRQAASTTSAALPAVASAVPPTCALKSVTPSGHLSPNAARFSLKAQTKGNP